MRLLYKSTQNNNNRAKLNMLKIDVHNQHVTIHVFPDANIEFVIHEIASSKILYVYMYCSFIY